MSLRSNISCRAFIIRFPLIISSFVGSLRPHPSRTRGPMFNAVNICYRRILFTTVSKEMHLVPGGILVSSNSLDYRTIVLFLNFLFAMLATSPTIILLKKDTIPSLCFLSFFIIARNLSNSIIPVLSWSTSSISSLACSLVSNNPTDSRSSYSCSVLIVPVFLSASELKYFFICLRSSSSKSIRYFFPFLTSHCRCRACCK